MEKFILNNNVIFRHEHFGSIIMNTAEKKVRMFNETATSILTNLFESKTLTQLSKAIGYSENKYDFSLKTFLDELVSKKIIDRTEEYKKTKASIHFEGIEHFPDGYFYSPLGVEIEYTMKCSRNCIYCAYSSNPLVDISKELNPSNWYSILENLKASGVIFLRFTGGDPLTREDFFDVLKMADDMNFILSVGTDLTLFKERHAILLSKLKNLVMVQTTLDGSTEEINDAMRGKGNYRKVLEGMILLKEYNIPFIVGTVLRKDNVHDIENIGKLVSEYKADGYCFAPLYTAGRASELEKLVPDNTDLYSANKQLKKLVSDGIVNPSDWVWHETVMNSTEDELKHLLDDQPHIARIPDRLIRIDPKGNCYSSIKLKQYLTEEEVYAGNLTKQSLLDIWHKSENLNKLRNLNNDKTFFGITTDLRQLTN